jgi:hypothetical protein
MVLPFQFIHPSPAVPVIVSYFPGRAAYAGGLKTRFVRSRAFDANLNNRHLHKIRTISMAARRARVNLLFTMQPIVHHSTRRSPCRAKWDAGTRGNRAVLRGGTAPPSSALAFA